MKAFKIILGILILLTGVLFLFTGGTDIQLGFGILFSYLGLTSFITK